MFFQLGEHLQLLPLVGHALHHQFHLHRIYVGRFEQNDLIHLPTHHRHLRSALQSSQTDPLSDRKDCLQGSR